MNKQNISPQQDGEVAVSYVKNINALTMISDLKSLVKFPVLVANVLPVFTGFWLALYVTNASFYEYFTLFLLTMFGSTMVMAGALVLNNWYDVDIDSKMARTKKRPTVTENSSLKFVLTLGIFLTLAGFILLLFTTVEATIYAFIGWFTYVVLYTMWSKRKYTLNTVIGSVSGAVTPLIGWTAVASGFHIVPIILFLMLFIWQMPHTFAIAMRKYDEYKAAGIAMLPVVHGFRVTKRQIVVYVASLLPLPFFLIELSVTFVIVATILTLVWVGISIYGLRTKNDQQYAFVSFLYSVNYITIVFLLLVILTLPVFK